MARKRRDLIVKPIVSDHMRFVEIVVAVTLRDDVARWKPYDGRVDRHETLFGDRFLDRHREDHWPRASLEHQVVPS